VNNGRFVRRALLRGTLAGGVATAAAAVPGRRTPGLRATTAAGGLVAGSALELPAVGGVLVLAAGVAHVVARRSGRPSLSPPVLAVGAATGGAAALLTTRVWPLAPRTPAEIRSAQTPLGEEAGGDGEGLTVLVNLAAGSPVGRGAARRLREALPAAEIVEVEEGPDLPAALERAASRARALGVAGGDGSINAAAAVAHRLGKPLLVVPAGTLNHLARDLGLASIDDAAAAFRDGHTVAVDLGTIDGHPFLNTASFGGYSALVDARERLEGRIGKWPALAVALARILRRGSPVQVEIDGRRRSLWMVFVGNCRYQPSGFAPTWRERLDDGELDVRLVDASRPWSRARLVLAVLTGRLGRCGAYEAYSARSLRVRALDGPLRLARDGETFDGSPEFTVEKEDRPLAVFVPRQNG
jgi:diacylglycerol kinase family enzyme